MKELAIGYCRVSSKKQKDMGLSLDAQEDYIRNWVNGNFGLVKVFKVQESAMKSERPHLKKTFQYCIENNIKHILITDSDRWTRSREMDIEAQKVIKEHDIQVHVIRENRIIGKYGSALEEFAHNVSVDAGQMVGNLIREKALAGTKKKLMRGEYPGLPPIGYRSIPKTRSGRPSQIVQTEDAEKMKTFLETFSSGKFSANQAVRLAKDLSLTNKSGKAFSRPQLCDKIKSQFYYGEFEWSHPLIDGGKSRIYENKTEGFKPLITKETWEKNCAILRDRQKNFRKKKLSFKFNDLMVCGRCGRKIYGARFDHNIEWETKDGKKVAKYKYDPYYLCTKGPWYTDNGITVLPEEYVDKERLVIKRDTYTTDEETDKKQLWLKEGQKVEERRCANPSFKESEIEQMLMDRLRFIKFNAAHWKRVKEALFKDETKDFIDHEIRMLKSEQAKTDGKLDKLYNDYCEEIIDVEFFKTKSAEVRERQGEIKNRLAELEEERAKFDERIGRSIEVLDAMRNWNKILKTASDEKKNHLIRLLTIKIETVYNSIERNDKKLEYKDLKFTFSPEVHELFTIGLLEEDARQQARMPRLDQGVKSPLIVEKLGMSAATLRIFGFSRFRRFCTGSISRPAFDPAKRGCCFGCVFHPRIC